MSTYPVDDEGVLEPADSLIGDDVNHDVLDDVLDVPRHWSPVMERGEHETLDERLAEEEPDVVPDSVDERWADGPRPQVRELFEGGESLGEASDERPTAAEDAAIHVIEEESGVDEIDIDQVVDDEDLS